MAGARTRYLIGAALDDGAIPIMLGGDHSMTYYALQACAQRVDRFGVLFLDAHGDLGAASHSSLDMLNHACFVRHALAFDSMTRLLAVGVRDQASPEAPPRIERVCAERARRMDAHAIIERLPADLPIYISIDIDVLDPTLAPDVLCPSEDGMSVGAVTDLLEVACAKRQVLGADLMEVGSTCRAEDPTPEAAARLLAKLLAALLDQLAATSNAPRTPRVSV